MAIPHIPAKNQEYLNFQKKREVGKQNKDNTSTESLHFVQPPAMSLPKGGGAIKSIDEKFSVNAVNGTATYSIPLPFSLGRKESTPSLSLIYNSGAGNSVFGLGWDINIPAIQRKIDKRLPQYRDNPDTDIFTLSGYEDLVPELIKNEEGKWVPHVISNTDHTIYRYRPRKEAGFSRVERLQEKQNTYWRVRTKENIVSVFGKNNEAKIINPSPGQEHKIFKWCLEYSYDDKGNFIVYDYKSENFENVASSVFETNRQKGLAALTNLYLKSVRYGNRIPYYEGGELPCEFLFELIFDFGEHDIDRPGPKQVKEWEARKDAFSDYRTGFEIRTYRLCRRVLMFHHFKELIQPDYLVQSMDFNYDEKEHLTYLDSITQTGYIWNQDGSLQSKKSLPPFEYSYFKPGFSTKVEELCPEQLANAPLGFDQKQYFWIDLYNEGIPGLLSEQPTSWLYNENLGNGHFNQGKLVSPKPSFQGLTAGTLTIQDLEANGKKYLVANSTTLKGYFELTDDQRWSIFHPFQHYPNINFNDPNLKFLDLTGDGMPDLLISLDQEFIWYESKGVAGFDDYHCALKEADEEKGPKIIFAEKNKQILVAIADMSGDGLGDIVIITHGSICYYPNLGYGQFGSRVKMKMNGHFDSLSDFNPEYIFLGDIDGSGTTDILYVRKEKIQVWFNQSGNSLSAPAEIFNSFPCFDPYSKISLIDLLGNGTLCLVWTSSLPIYRNSPLRYIDIMKGRKPHLLYSFKNNSGKETFIEYKTSTQYYLEDKKNNIQWITKLQFPVHCISKITTIDKVSQTRFTNEYTYRHGYYDAREREFRGFAYVEQRDGELYEHYIKQTKQADAVNAQERDLYQPVVVSKTWFHTGAFFDHTHFFKHLQQEFYPQNFLKNNPVIDDQLKATLQTYAFAQSFLPGEFKPENIAEYSDALKGSVLRSELYSDEGPEIKKQHPYTVIQHNYDLCLLQPKQQNKHAVVQTLEKEIISFQYERNPVDPRITHTINIEMDYWGNVLQAASIAYGRKLKDLQSAGEGEQDKQTTHLIIYTKNKYTEIIDTKIALRLPVPCEARAWELNLPRNNGFFKADDISEGFIKASIKSNHETTSTYRKKKIRHTKTLFLKNDLSGPMPFGLLDSLALPFESYHLAFTPALITDIFQDKADEDLLRNKAGYLNFLQDENYWSRSGKIHFHRFENNEQQIEAPQFSAAGFARDNFYLPVAYEDPFGKFTQVFYDHHHLFVLRSVDTIGNQASILSFNYRTLTPYLLEDVNDNRSGIRLNELGLVTDTFMMGKESEKKGDFLDQFNTELSVQDQPTMVFEYDFRFHETMGKLPNRVITKARELHYHDDPSGITRWQKSYSYSNGSGQEMMKKVEAEPGPAPLRDQQGILVKDSSGSVVVRDSTDQVRYIASGKTIFSNKGNPVKQYEPWFDSSPEYNTERELTEIGCTSILFYDALSRLIKTDHPNGTFSKMDFDAWSQETFDENDTVLDSLWYKERINGNKGKDEQAAAKNTELHYGTPLIAHLDALGRSFLTVAQNRFKIENEVKDQWYYTKTNLDIQGNPLSVKDPRGNTVVSWKYNMLGTVCYKETMDSGNRWMIADCMGKNVRLWDDKGHVYTHEYDQIHRPLRLLLRGNPTKLCLKNMNTAKH